MGHPDEGEIRALLDGEAGEASRELEAHLQQCSRCGAVARDQELAMAALSEALALVDVTPSPGRLRRRIPRSRRNNEGFRLLARRYLPRAASVALFLTAGAAAALPGSPVRQWVIQGWEGLSPGGAADSRNPAPIAEPMAATDEATGGPGMVGASLPVKAGGMTVRIRGVVEGGEIRVILVEGAQVGVFAGEGARFRTEAGSLEVRGAPGSVTVEVPRDAHEVEVLVDGLLYLRQRGGETEVLGPVRERTPTEIRFGLSLSG
ncbi:MAG: zf-HC2 domain-containing protein [Gemmatimonadota bacterium]